MTVLIIANSPKLAKSVFYDRIQRSPWHYYKLVPESWGHISAKHPEITLELIQDTVSDPDVVLISEQNTESLLHFKKRLAAKERYTLVIIKIKSDGYWISTAMTKNKISGGTEIYRKIL